MIAEEIIRKILKPWIPRNLISEELSGLYGNAVLAEMGQIIEYYNIYSNGADFPVSTESAYIPSNMRYKLIKSLIDKEARFMFAKSPDVNLKAVSAEEADRDKVTVYQKYINDVLKHNHFKSNLIKAAKDCFIGKRIAVFCNFSEQYGISISFVPSLEFVYDTDSYGNLTKIIAFYSLNNAELSNDQRIHKKKYWLENGFCHVTEGIYDGAGKLVETVIGDETTAFPYIPAAVIINDGLTGDMQGESEVMNLYEYEKMYSKLANADIDAEKQGMNPIRWAMDLDSNSTKDLSIAPGAFWDLHSNSGESDNKGSVGVMETQLNYSEPMNTTLRRLRDSMYELIDMPVVSTSDLQGVVTSGKTLKAIYWPLIVRCDEKFLAWKPKLEFIIKCIVDGAFYYPKAAERYTEEKLREVDYTVDIINRYPLPEDEAEEKATDLSEVSSQSMSRKSYLKKWRNMTDDEADEEIRQIALERQIMEEAYYPKE